MQNMQDIKNLIRRRILIFLLSSIPIFIAVVVVAFILPPIYVSKSTILIESQQIPEEYVKATVTGYVEERLQAITQQILSRSNLTDIINQCNLYAEMRKKYATEIVLDKMRKDINLETIQAGGGRRGSGITIAFTLSYEGKNPEIVQKVASVLASLYLEQNLKTREAQATRTTQFLQQELDDIKRQIDEHALKISEFKKAHIGELPEYNEINLSALEQFKRDFGQADMQILSLQERKVYLEGQLANISPSTYAGEEGGGEFGATPEERLNALRLRLINLRSNLSDKHPDVIKLKREIEELENRALTEKGTSEEGKKLTDLKNKLVAMKSKFGPQHPDVLKLSKEVAGLSQEIEKIKEKNLPSALASQNPVNPAYINLKTQLDSTTLEINHLLDERNRIKKKMKEYQEKIERTPLIEKEYESLNTDYNNAKVKYNEIMSKLMEARVAKGMEETQHGERFTIIEPAATPGAPEKPDRRKILLMGLFLALGVGAGLAFVQENLDHSIKSEHELDEFAHIPVLSSIPVIESDEEIKRRHKRIITGILIGISGIIAAIFIIHFFIMPLDIIWIKIQQKIFIKM